MADKRNPAYRHGHAGKGRFSATYRTWASMVQRCSNPLRQSWKHYGGRGIKVCDRWKTFDGFLEDMGKRPEGMTLDRIDSDGDYEPKNCRWADSTTQARNSKQVVWVEINGVRRRLVEWCEILGVSVHTVRDRVKYYGHTYESALLKSKRVK